jgi:hypothetical protein
VAIRLLKRPFCPQQETSGKPQVEVVDAEVRRTQFVGVPCNRFTTSAPMFRCWMAAQTLLRVEING